MTNLSALDSPSDRAAPAIPEQQFSDDARRRQLRGYLDHGLRSVSGWLDKRSARIIATLGAYQSAQGIRGALGEIGVHHGKLFILLDLMRTADETSFAVDLFDEQDQNVDQSGLGDYARLLHNLETFSGGMSGVKIVKGSSLALQASELLALCGPARMFSVDGGHTAACASNDVALAEQATIDEGIVIVDDYFNPMWPDVSIGVSQHIFQNGSQLRPFAISPNKLYLARVPCHDRYRAVLRERARRYFLKTSEMYDHAVDIYGYDPSSSWRRRVINYVKKSPIGGPAHALYRRYRAGAKGDRT